MAKIGLNNFRYGILTETEDGTASYGAATKPGKAISCTVEIESNEAKLYADDALAESDRSFRSGTVTAGLDEEDLETMAALLGHTVSDGEIVRKATDTAPYVGLGRVVTKMVGGVYKYKVEFLSKVQFSEPEQEDNTKGEELEFSTIELEGSVVALADGTWSKSKTFTSKAAAINYIEGLFAHWEVSFDANGGTGSVSSINVPKESSITLPGGTGLTAPTGKVFGGWGTSAEATTAQTSPYTPTQDTTLYAIWNDAT